MASPGIVLGTRESLLARTEVLIADQTEVQGGQMPLLTPHKGAPWPEHRVGGESPEPRPSGSSAGVRKAGRAYHFDGPQRAQGVCPPAAGPRVPAWVFALFKHKLLALAIGLLIAHPTARHKKGSFTGHSVAGRALALSSSALAPPKPKYREAKHKGTSVIQTPMPLTSCSTWEN